MKILPKSMRAACHQWSSESPTVAALAVANLLEGSHGSH